MAVIMAVAGFVAVRGLRQGVQQEAETGQAELSVQPSGEDPDADLYSAPR
jgi:hypothetical protein